MTSPADPLATARAAFLALTDDQRKHIASLALTSDRQALHPVAAALGLSTSQTEAIIQDGISATASGLDRYLRLKRSVR